MTSFVLFYPEDIVVFRHNEPEPLLQRATKRAACLLLVNLETRTDGQKEAEIEERKRS
jgi:hypothetical protein